MKANYTQREKEGAERSLRITTTRVTVSDFTQRQIGLSERACRRVEGGETKEQSDVLRSIELIELLLSL